MEDMIITKADLTDTESNLYKTMSLVEDVINKMESATNEMRKKRQEVCEYLAKNDATAEELEEKFFIPMNDIVDELEDFWNRT